MGVEIYKKKQAQKIEEALRKRQEALQQQQAILEQLNAEIEARKAILGKMTSPTLRPSVSIPAPGPNITPILIGGGAIIALIILLKKR